MKISTLLLTGASCANAFVLPEKGFNLLDLAGDSRRSEVKQYTDSSRPNLRGDSSSSKPLISSHKLQSMINVEELNETAQLLYKLAEESVPLYGHPTRVVGSPGHWATLDYIQKEFDELDEYYDVSVQYFSSLISQINSYNLTYTNGDEVPSAVPFSFSPPVKTFRGKLLQIPNYGCEEKDYADLDVSAEQIALIERGACSFLTKSDLAGRFGFKAVIMYDNNPAVREGLKGSLGRPTEDTLPVIGVSHEVGCLLIQAIEKYGDYPVFFGMNSIIRDIVTKNVIADTKSGDPDNIVALGAHSDSVADGPGINDDGSGTISLLTIAKHLSKFRLNNKVRFAWWSAEEYGLLGSNFYTDNLTPEENLKIRLFMDYDMLASPNFEYEVYDGNNEENPEGSEELKQFFIDYYNKHNLKYSLIPFDGRSDYVGFIQNGIPAGGVATGAEAINPANGEAFDKCYHQLCDDTSNLNFEAWLVNTKLIAHAVATYAHSLKGFPERSSNSSLHVASARHVAKFPYRGNHLIM
ncbi:HBR416Wp [Eremothecium sinecaudum]|uniref:Peptide hydrolase n=1 Tax=Eremothecium sinecaudum TaxID=45286 RepID=A0A109UXV5_9SACH|nr:HBR416Wp [Eremothecium sinecaudum]AMD19317.1 HBR416Wp [Eremothecium sinecaudum]